MKNSNTGTELVRGATWLTLGTHMEQFGFMIFFIVAARVLIVEDIGLIAFILMIPGLVATFGLISFPQATIHFVARYRGKGEISNAKATYLETAKLVFISGFSLTIFVFIGTCLSSSHLGSQNIADAVKLVTLDILPVMMIQVLAGSLMGAEKFKQVGFSGTAGSTAKTGLSIISLLLNGSLSMIVFSWVIGDVLQCMILFSAVRRTFLGATGKPPSLRNLMQFSAPLYLTGILDYIQVNGDKFLIFLFLGAVALGLYTPVIAGAAIVLNLASSISRPLLSRFSSVEGSSDRELLLHLAQRSSKWVMLVLAPIGLGLAVESDVFLNLIAGPAYSNAAMTFAILSISTIIAGQYYIIRSAFFGMGKTKMILLSSSIAVVSNFVILVMLLTHLGILGAGFARFAMISVQFATLIIIFTRKERMNLKRGDEWKPLPAAILMMVGLIISRQILPGIEFLLIRVLVGMICYAASLRLLSCVNQSDIALIEDYFPKAASPFLRILRLVAKPRD